MRRRDLRSSACSAGSISVLVGMSCFGGRALSGVRAGFFGDDLRAFFCSDCSVAESGSSGFVSGTEGLMDALKGDLLIHVEVLVQNADMLALLAGIESN